MTDKDIQFQMDLLWRDGYHAAARIIGTLQTTISRKVEMDYLKTFVQQGCFSEELSWNQLRCMWTAYCFHHNLDVDTSGYDEDLNELWDAMGEPNREGFDNFMCEYLV